MKKLFVILSLIIVFTISCKHIEDNNEAPTATVEIQPRDNSTESTPVITEPKIEQYPKKTEEIDEIDKKEEKEVAEEADEIDEDPVINNGINAYPWIDSDLKENITENMELNPKEDFYLYANYDWLKSTEIPEGEYCWSVLDEVGKQIRENALTVIHDESLEGHDAELIRDLYKSIINWDERNKKGLTPFKQLLDEIDAIESLDNMINLICDPEKNLFLSRFISVSIEPAISDSSKYIVAVRLKRHISLFGETWYITQSQETAEKELVASMMELAGYNRAEAAQMYESAIIHVDSYLLWNPKGDDAIQKDNFYEENSVIMSKDEIQKLTKEFPLMRILESFGVENAEEYQVYYPETFKSLDDIYSENNLRFIKKYLMVSCAMNMALLLDRDADNIVNNYYRTLYGTQGEFPDDMRALSQIKTYLEDTLAHVYIQKYDASETKNRVTELIEKIIDEYSDMLEEEDWISEATKEYAIEKLDSIKINAIYPDEWTDFSKLDLTGLSYMDAIIRIEKFKWQKSLEKIGCISNRNEWKSGILDTNAFYAPLYNSIYICLGIVDGDFYYNGITDEELYAGLGITIGHEISHAFDTNGALYDKNGDYVNWWTKEDYEAFQNRSEKLIKYFNNITAWRNGFVNGKQICEETIADIAGMKVILKIAEKIPDFDYVKFFTAYAKYWRIISTPEYEQYLFEIDTHLLNYLRTNAILQQFDIFFEAFDIKEGDKMFLAPKKRIMIW